MQTKQATIMRAPCAGARAARTFLPPALLHALEGGHRRSGAYQQRDERTARRSSGSILMPRAPTGRFSASRGPCPWPRRQHDGAAVCYCVSYTQVKYEG